MEHDEGIRWLSRAWNIDLQIREKIYHIEALYTCCGLQGIAYDRISVVSSPENKFERIMADIDKERREIERLRKRRKKIVDEITARIETLDVSPERTILMGYYVKGDDMKNIAKDLGYEWKYCYKLRDKGIEKL